MFTKITVTSPFQVQVETERDVLARALSELTRAEIRTELTTVMIGKRRVTAVLLPDLAPAVIQQKGKTAVGVVEVYP